MCNSFMQCVNALFGLSVKDICNEGKAGSSNAHKGVYTQCRYWHQNLYIYVISTSVQSVP